MYEKGEIVIATNGDTWYYIKASELLLANQERSGLKIERELTQQ